MKLKRIKIGIVAIAMSIFTFANNSNNIIMAASKESILALIQTPISGISLPSNIVAQVESYLLAHPNIDYDKLEAQVNNAIATVKAAVQGKEVKSLSDISNCITSEQKKSIISSLQQAAKEAEVSIALDNQSEPLNAVTVVDKNNSVPLFKSGTSIIKSTGRLPNISLWAIRSSLFLIVCIVEVSCLYVYKKYNN